MRKTLGTSTGTVFFFDEKSIRTWSTFNDDSEAGRIVISLEKFGHRILEVARDENLGLRQETNIVEQDYNPQFRR